MLCTGCMIAMQSPINAALSRNTGSLEASLISFFTGTILLGIAVSIFGNGSLLSMFRSPAWQWCGGLLGAVMVFAGIISVPKIGVLSTALAMIVGNLIMAAVIDNYGWFGVPINPFTPGRLIGLCLALISLFFIFKT